MVKTKKLFRKRKNNKKLSRNVKNKINKTKKNKSKRKLPIKMYKIFGGDPSPDSSPQTDSSPNSSSYFSAYSSKNSSNFVSANGSLQSSPESLSSASPLESLLSLDPSLLAQNAQAKEVAETSPELLLLSLPTKKSKNNNPELNFNLEAATEALEHAKRTANSAASSAETSVEIARKSKEAVEEFVNELDQKAKQINDVLEQSVKLQEASKTAEVLSKQLDEYRDIEYNIAEIPPFWKPYILNNNPSLQDDAQLVRKHIKYLINNIYFCSYITFTTDNELYHNIICNSFLFIAYVTLLLNEECSIVVKGGKAIQLAITINGCSAGKLTRYISPDVDIVIIKKPESKYTTKILAKEIGKLFLWVMNSTQQPIVSLLDVEYPEPIIKISLIKPEGGFYAIMDIGHNELNENIKSYFQGESLRQLTFKNNAGIIFYPKIQSLMNERLYYLIKYFNGDYNDLDAIKKNSIERFIEKIYKSINALLNCTITDSKRTNKGKISLLNMLLFNVYKEKFSFNEINMSKRIELNNKIIKAILKRNFDISQYYSPDYE